MQVEDEKQAAAMTMTAAAESESGGCGEAAGGERKRKTKTTRGRQKIEIKRIERLAARYVCFSKRHTGLIKKAADLVALCGVHVAVVVFSQAGKPFSFGHPSVNAVFGRYLDDSTSAGGVGAAPAAAAPGEETARLLAPLLHEYRRERERLEKAIEVEASRRKALDAAARAVGVRAVTGGDDLRGVGMPELVAMLAALERVQAEAVERMRVAIAEEAMMQQWQCAPAGSGGDGSGGAFSYPGAGAFVADGGAASSSRQGVMDTQTMLMLGGGDVIKQAATMPIAPMTLPPYLPPPPPLIYGADYNQFAGYGYDLGGGSCHDAAYEIEGCYGTATTCNFFE
ncbi:unnamed protein product [Urochloa decumbens]|uniref:MADS-box domain-containing protein n=1 Tax=Urochloa decumbens TaxID=240449 RepID=A0ABC9DNS6_9POAL